MKRAVVLVLVGFLIGELDPIGWVVWRAFARQLPAIQERSLQQPSPFEALPSSRWVAQSEHAYVIEDRWAPTAPVHLLVVPKQRYPSVLEPPTAVLGEMLDLARRAAREQGIADSGFRILINTNPHGVQTVYHLHMHVKGGRQQREAILPFLWSRLKQLARGA